MSLYFIISLILFLIGLFGSIFVGIWVNTIGGIIMFPTFIGLAIYMDILEKH